MDALPRLSAMIFPLVPQVGSLPPLGARRELTGLEVRARCPALSNPSQRQHVGGGRGREEKLLMGALPHPLRRTILEPRTSLAHPREPTVHLMQPSAPSGLPSVELSLSYPCILSAPHSLPPRASRVPTRRTFAQPSAPPALHIHSHCPRSRWTMSYDPSSAAARLGLPIRATQSTSQEAATSSSSEPEAAPAPAPAPAPPPEDPSMAEASLQIAQRFGTGPEVKAFLRQLKQPLSGKVDELRSRLEQTLSTRKLVVVYQQNVFEKGHSSVIVDKTRADEAISRLESLMLACKEDNVADLRNALANGAKVNYVSRPGDNSRMTPLLTCAENGSIKCLSLLLDLGARADITGTVAKDSPGMPGYVTLTSYLTPVWFASRGGHLSCVQKLITAGATVKAAEHADSTPLHAACEGGNIDVIKALLAANASPLEQDRMGLDPIDTLFKQGNAKCAQLLLAAGASINGRPPYLSKTPIFFACSGDHYDCVQLAIDSKADVNSKTREGWTALHECAIKGSPNCAALLLEAGAEVDPQAENGATPLYKAVTSKRPEVAEVLLAYGADPDVRTNFPVDWDGIDLMGASLGKRTESDWTPRGFAQRTTTPFRREFDTGCLALLCGSKPPKPVLPPRDAFPGGGGSSSDSTADRSESQEPAHKKSRLND